MLEDFAEMYDNMWRTTEIPPHTNYLLNVIEKRNFIKNGMDILDIGCGNGLIGKRLAALFRINLFGCDISDIGLELSKESGYTVEKRNLDLDERSFFDGKLFDVIILSAVLEHVIYPENLLMRAAAQLKPGGVVIVQIPNVCWFPNRLLFLFGIWHFRLLGGMRGHISYRDKHQLVRMFQDAQLSDTDWSHSPVCIVGNSAACRGVFGVPLRLLSQFRARWSQGFWAFNFIIIAKK